MPDTIISAHQTAERDRTETHVFNLDALPYTPKDWSVERHSRLGGFPWDPDKIGLYLSREWQGRRYVEDYNRRFKRGPFRIGLFCFPERLREINRHWVLEELGPREVLNATLLDCLLKKPHLIPDEWEGIAVLFPGTIYRDEYGRRCVRGYHMGRACSFPYRLDFGAVCAFTDT